MPSADAKRSRRTIRLRTRERTSQRALRGERKSEERREKDGNGGQWETGTRGGKECCVAQNADCRKSVVQIGHTSEAGHSEQKRPERSPGSTP